MQKREHIRLGIHHLGRAALIPAIRCFGRGLGVLKKQPWKEKESAANRLLKENRLDEADVLFCELTRDYPELPVGLFGRARAARAGQDWNQALEYLETLLQLFNQASELAWEKQRADALMHLGRYDEAETAFRILHEKQSAEPWGTIGLAMTAAARQDWHKALELWDSCFNSYPEFVSPWWHNQKIRVLSAMGDTKSARDLVKQSHTSDTAREWFSIFDGGKEQNLKDAQPRLNFDSVLVISYGRSGSTLLQGILNSIDGVLVRGENQNIFHHLYQMQECLNQLKSKHAGAVMPNQPWYGAGCVDPGALYPQFREIAKSLILSDRLNDESILCYGFKEVRYHELGDQLEAYLDFLSNVFPKPALIFNTRNLDDVVKSGWWRDKAPETVRDHLGVVERRFTNYASGKSNCFSICYENVIANGPVLESMYSFLGAVYDQQRINTVLSVPHSYSPSQGRVKKLFEDF